MVTVIDSMVSAITNLFGEYVPLNGEGLASLNFPWIVGAIIGIIFLWFLLEMVLILIRGGGRRG